MYSRRMSRSPSYADTLAVLDRVGRALSDGTRRRILLRLAGAPAYPAGLAAHLGARPPAGSHPPPRLPDPPAYPADLADHLGASRPAVSNHLACLRDCGLVVADAEGRRVRYRLAHATLATPPAHLAG